MLTVQTVGGLIETSRSRPRLGGNRAILLGLAILLGALLADPHLFGMASPLSWILPQILILAVLVVFIRAAYLQRRLAGLMMEAFEAVQLQQWERAAPLLEAALSKPVHHPQARCELLLGLAAAAEAQQQYDAAQRVYEAVLEENRGDALQLHTARVALAAAMLRTGQTADAVSLIDRLTRAEMPDQLRAQVELLSLLRELMMGQSRDHLERAEERRRLFRQYLSTRAAYGYALLAAAFDRADRAQEAARFWHDATLLVRPAELVRRFQDVEPVAARYPHAEVPW